MKVAFCGATRGVTGSSHLVSVNGKNILLDCGLFQGRRSEADALNREFPFKPSELHGVVLSHAHTDHSGRLPLLVKQGFKGNIYATAATRDLAVVMLQDTAFLQRRDAEFVSKKRARRNLPPVEPLYSLEDAQAVTEHFFALPFHRPIDISDGVTLTFYNSGHILGSAVVVLELKEKRAHVRLAFTGDLGRKQTPILKDPEFCGDVHYLIAESTYGNRLHKPKDEVERVLTDVIRRTYERGGKILIPAFSVGRTQEMLYFFNQLYHAGKMPKDMMIFLDSPLAQDVTNVYRYHPECFDKEMNALIADDKHPLRLENVAYARSAEDSKKLNDYEKPCIILAGSGMAEGGRIAHHLANNIENPKTTILIVGYMAENTLGRKILERQPEVNIFGEPYKLRAEVVVMNNFSAHADRAELLDYIGQFSRSEMRAIFLVHGEDAAAQSLRDGLKELGFKRVEIPSRLETFELL
ncbi:MAG: MBL fold metallo-hydrolase [Chloroherpetonaceae bacterium]|nr:MBL fold metallo-hydrolase [Chloroherpetonaceae bacterium]MDW8436622.1 MBL fold metallo-hydrolase [Chloroherpetonaceae bacterium]